MADRFHHITLFHGGENNWSDPKDIDNNQLSKAQNVSVDKIGRIRTVGALGSHGEVPTQTAEICPGSGLKIYSSDHWQEASPTVSDLLAADNAASDEGGEVNAVGSWVEGGPAGTIVESSVADLDGGTIPSNGTSYVMKCVGGSAGLNRRWLYQSFTTIVGRKYIASADLCNFNEVGIWLQIGSSAAGGSDLGFSSHKAGDPLSWSNRQIGFIATTTTTYVSILCHVNEDGIVYFDDVYVSELPSSDLKGDWLALSDAANAQVDLYSDNSDLFTDGLLDFGTVATYVATADTINFPTTSTITDSTSQFLNKNMQPGQVWIISGAAETGNNRLIYLERVIAGTLYIRGTPLTVDADDDGTITFTKYNPTEFHFVDEALRASPVNGGVALRPKHYSFVDRIHFGDDLAGGDKYQNWYLNDVGPIAPTDLEVTANNGDQAAGDLTAVAGFEIGVVDAAGGDWAAGTYEQSVSFIYDDGQESKFHAPSTAETHVVAADNSKLTLTVRAKTSSTGYDERISGGRVYTRISGSDDPWKLLADISMTAGARATLSTDYSAWNDSGTTNVVYTDNFVSLRLNLDTYESLTGRDPGVALIPFSADNTFWDASVIAGNRCFLASSRYEGAGGTTSYFRDRILYSSVNQYDIFPIKNYIDVTRGDADDYVRLIHFNDRIMAFKQRNLFIVNISDSNSSNWFLEGTHYFSGILHAGAVFNTPHGVAWSNEVGAFLYDGSQVINLTDFKIDRDTWATFHTDYSIVGYYKKTDTLVVMGDCTQDGSGHAYFFDFTTQAWTYGSGVFNSAAMYTNFETDWNEDLIIGAFTKSSPLVTTQTWSDTPVGQTTDKIDIRTKDINFGSEFYKEISEIVITYKSSAIQTSAVKYALNGATSFSAFSPTGDLAVATAWTRLVIEQVIPCASIRLQITNPTNTGTIEINDISFAYRDIPERFS